MNMIENVVDTPVEKEVEDAVVDAAVVDAPVEKEVVDAAVVKDELGSTQEELERVQSEKNDVDANLKATDIKEMFYILYAFEKTFAAEKTKVPRESYAQKSSPRNTFG